MTNALESALRRPQREELARVESFMFEKLIARVPLNSSRLNNRTLRKLIDNRLDAGKWQRVKEETRRQKYNSTGVLVWETLAPVYRLSPDYMRAIASQDMIQGRYSKITASRALRQRKPLPPEGMPLKVGLWLNQGGIKWNPLTVLSMLSSPVNAEAWRIALKGWKRLSPLSASLPLLPSWSADNRVGWIYASKPDLQMIPSAVRSHALAVDGFPMAEADLCSCQLNILNHGQGVGIMGDPLTDTVHRLNLLHGININRADLKAVLYPLLHGRGYLPFIRQAERELFLPEVQARQLWKALTPLRTANGLELMQKQAEIMSRALEIMEGLGSAPVLPLFDAIQSIDPGKARDALEQASQDILGSTVPIPALVKYARQAEFAI